MGTDESSKELKWLPLEEAVETVAFDEFKEVLRQAERRIMEAPPAVLAPQIPCIEQTQVLCCEYENYCFDNYHLFTYTFCYYT